MQMALTEAQESAAAEERHNGQEIAARQAQADALQAQVEKLDREVASSEGARLDAAQVRSKLETAEKSLPTFAQRHGALMADLKGLQARLGRPLQGEDSHARKAW